MSALSLVAVLAVLVFLVRLLRYYLAFVEVLPPVLVLD